MTEPYRPIAPPPYRSPDQFPGPCYVLDPVLWNELGWREVIAVLPPRLPAYKARGVVVYRPAVLTGATRDVVVTTKGRPWDWHIERVPIVKTEPLWHTRARLLHARGMSLRRIAEECGRVSHIAVRNVIRAGLTDSRAITRGRANGEKGRT